MQLEDSTKLATMRRDCERVCRYHGHWMEWDWPIRGKIQLAECQICKHVVALVVDGDHISGRPYSDWCSDLERTMPL
jgi:hypothetical protein